MLQRFRPGGAACLRRVGRKGREHGTLPFLGSACFEGCEFHHVPRANNEAAAALAMVGSTRHAIPLGVSLEHLRKPTITPSPESDSIVLNADPGTAGTAPHP